MYSFISDKNIYQLKIETSHINYSWKWWWSRIFDKINGSNIYIYFTIRQNGNSLKVDINYDIKIPENLVDGSYGINWSR